KDFQAFLCALSQALAASLGLEPRQRDPESLVLPLHHEAIWGRKVSLKIRLFQADRTKAGELRISSLPSCAASTAIDMPVCASCMRAFSTMRSTMASS